MTNNILKFGEYDPAASRQDLVDTLHRLIEGSDDLKIFPVTLKMALEGRVWEQERKSASGKPLPVVSFHDFVHQRYPVGLGSTYEICENLMRGHNDVLALWAEVTKRSPGNPSGVNQHTQAGDAGIVDNIHNSSIDRPSGTSAAAGLRKLQKAAAEGNDEAREQLAQAVAGEKSVHRACVDSGLRKATRIDRDVKQRCDRANAERLVEYLPAEVLDACVSDLFAAGHKTLAIEIKNLTGESIMDRRFA